MHKIIHEHVRDLYLASVAILKAIDGDVKGLDKTLFRETYKKGVTNEVFIKTIALFLHNAFRYKKERI